MDDNIRGNIMTNKKQEKKSKKCSDSTMDQLTKALSKLSVTEDSNHQNDSVKNASTDVNTQQLKKTPKPTKYYHGLFYHPTAKKLRYSQIPQEILGDKAAEEQYCRNYFKKQ
jgi:hypothetical protein